MLQAFKYSFILIMGIIFASQTFAVTQNHEKIEKKELQPVNLLLDWKPNTNHIGIYAALREKFYEKNGIQLTIVNPTQTTTTVLVGSGQENFGVSYANDVIYARNAGVPVVSVAGLVQTDLSCFVWRSSTPIHGIKDFEGKRYGGRGSPEETATLKYLMEKDGAKFAKLKMMTIGNTDFLVATPSLVDFTWEYLGWNILSAKLEHVAVQTYCPSEHDPLFDKPSPLLITGEKLIKEQPDLVRRFVQATKMGYEFAIKYPNKAAEDLINAQPELSAQLVEKSAVYLAPFFQGKAKEWGYLDPVKFRKYANWMEQVKLIARVPNTSHYIDNTFLTGNSK